MELFGGRSIQKFHFFFGVFVRKAVTLSFVDGNTCPPELHYKVHINLNDRTVSKITVMINKAITPGDMYRNMIVAESGLT